MRSETVIIDLTDRLDAGRCRQWLNQLRAGTTDSGLHRLVDDVTNELAMIGELAEDLTDVVVGAMASVEAAFDCVEAV